MTRIKNLINIPIFSFVALCNFYITELTKLSPAYFGIGLVLIAIPFFYMQRKIKFNINYLILVLLLFFYCTYLFIDCIILEDFDNVSSYFYSFFFNQFMFILSAFLISMLFSKQVKTVVAKMTVFTVIVLIWDCINRFTHVLNKFSGVLAFYNYKFNSIMFVDSNWAGFIGMCLFATLIYLRDSDFFYKKGYILFVFLLVCLTISRAAIVCCILVLILSKFMRSKKKIQIAFVFGIPTLIISIFLVFTKLTDGSFLTKLEIIDGMLYYFKNFPELLLFGNGIGSCGLNENSFMFNGCWFVIHAYFAQKIVDIGLMGFFLELLFFFLCIICTRGKYLYLLMPFLFCGFSMCPLLLPYYYIETALVFCIENKMLKDLQQYKETCDSKNQIPKIKKEH